MRTPEEWNAIYERAMAHNADKYTSDQGLKACPSCGGKAKLEDMGYPHHVYCVVCGCRVRGEGFGPDGEADAIRRWNNADAKELKR